MSKLFKLSTSQNAAAKQEKQHAHGADMSGAFVSNKRRVRFELSLRIIDLNNVPLVSGTSLIKWHLPSSTAAEHRGRTNKCAIRDHRVAYDYEKQIPVRLSVGKDGMLQECSVHFEVLQEYSSSGRGESIKLGTLKLNLSEYVEASELQTPATPAPGLDVAEEGVVRRYLMQDSKINSTLKIGVNMRHLEGTRDYYAPPLRTAPVFGGIAGIISSSEPVGSAAHGMANAANVDPDAPEANLPNLSSSNKELGEMQDMYRRSLAAFWASQPGELKADDCVEDIFAGGDGWGKGGRPEITDPREIRHDVFNTASRSGSGTSTPNPEQETQPAVRPKSGHSQRPAMGMNMGRHKDRKIRGPRKGQGELDEFDVRDDLRVWRIGERAYG